MWTTEGEKGTASSRCRGACGHNTVRLLLTWTFYLMVGVAEWESECAEAGLRGCSLLPGCFGLPAEPSGEGHFTGNPAVSLEWDSLKDRKQS